MKYGILSFPLLAFFLVFSTNLLAQTNPQNSPHYSSFKKLYEVGKKKGPQAVELEEYVKLLWFPQSFEWDYQFLDLSRQECIEKVNASQNTPDNTFFFSCQNHSFGPLIKGTVAKGSEQYLSPACSADTLYSWGSQERTRSTLMRLGQHILANSWEKKACDTDDPEVPLYMALTPAITHGYGIELIRYKIRPQTPFITGAGQVQRKGYSRESLHRQGIRYRTDWFGDFTIYNAGHIESYSFGTPELYDEIIRDIRRIESCGRAQIYKHLGVDKSAFHKKEVGLEHLWIPYDEVEYNTDFSQDALKVRLHHLIGQILKNEGRVITQRRFINGRNQAQLYFDHYQTQRPTYFNPQ